MQPQAHVQVFLNMVEFGMPPQKALDASRIFVTPQNNGAEQRKDIGPILIEEGISQAVIGDLKGKGHDVKGPVSSWDRKLFGRGHIASKESLWKNHSETTPENDVLWGASDPRSDGCAISY